MPTTLYTKLSLVLVLVLASIGLLYALLSVSTAHLYQQQVDQALNRNLARNLVTDRNLVQAGRLNEQAVSDTFMQYMTINPSIEIYLLDHEGTILSYSADPGKVVRNRVSLDPIIAFLEGDDSYPLLGDDPRSHEGQKAFSVTPVPSQQEHEGYLYVVLRGEQYDNAERLIKESYLLRLSGWSVAASLVIGLLAGLLLFRLLTRRLYRLTSLIDDFRESGFTHVIPYTSKHKSHDEIDTLGATFNEMAQRIAEQLEALKNQDNLRRELVANVSHDLRTPLAIQYGYLETLKLKAHELSEKERNEYIESALKSSENLAHLIAELFELAKLDAQAIKPVFEPFSIAELAQDVLQKFQLKANEKNITLHLNVGEATPFVEGDIRLIDRVLFNLIVNALRHTPEGGEVTITLHPKRHAVEMQVSDSGCGINDEDIPFIFERFYQASGKHAGESQSGLGLAIAKRILALHKSTIQVSSDVNVGTTFTFQLAYPR